MSTRRDFLHGSLAAATVAMAGCTASNSVPVPVASGAADPSLAALLERMFQAQMRVSPESMSGLGLDHGANAAAKHRLDDRSVAARERFAREQGGFLRELDAIDRQRLSADAQVPLDAAHYLCALHVQGAQQFGYGLSRASQPYVLSQIDGAYLDVPDLLENRHRIEVRADAEAYLARLAALPAAIDQDSDRAGMDAARGVVPNGFLIDKALAQLKTLRDAPPVESPLIASLVRRTAEKELAGDWQTPATQIVQGPLRQALDRQIALLESWRSSAVATPGVARLPDGEAYYRWAVQLNTTTRLSATEIHHEALDQVAELSARIDVVLRKQGLSKGSVGERYVALATDPRHRYSDTDAGMAQRLDDLQARLRDMQTRLPQHFGARPNAVPILRGAPPALEYFHPGASQGSRPNVLSLSQPGIAKLPKWELASWIYHESLPGHHLQASLARESAQVPALLKTAALPVFTEGWSLYAEQLVGEMGVYAADPLAPLGYLRAFLLRAAHVVVDTGVHAQGWSRDRAIAYVGQVSGDPAAAAANRVDRYCARPAQAIVYKFGHTRWLTLRARARQRLGAKFDLRQFHDAGLRHGALPLEVLERVIDDWIQDTK